VNTLALCIPAYNASLYLPRLLTSALSQDIPFSEILVYDDCSTDNTSEVAEKYGAKVIRGSENKGCSFGKNMLARATMCDWIHFHDADDELLPNFTTLANNWMVKKDCPDVILFNYEYRDNDTNSLLGIMKFDKARLEKDPIAYSIAQQINPFCGLYKRAAYLKAGGYDIDPLILYNEDKAFHIKLAIKKLTFSAEDEISIINYRMQSSMSAANQHKCLIAQYHVLESTAASQSNIYSFEIATQLWICATLLAARQDWPYVKKALSLSKRLGYRSAIANPLVFTLLSYLNPFAAVWSREKLIRLLKPEIRE